MLPATPAPNASSGPEFMVSDDAGTMFINLGIIAAF
jgi:hypothetical protein